MIAVLQRVSEARVVNRQQLIGEINTGILVLLGIEKGDSNQDVNFLVNKILSLRIFNDNNGKMNFSIKDIDGSILVVSQFTLCADMKSGRRPSFSKAESPEKSNKLYECFVLMLKNNGLKVETGKFGAMMNVELNNHGPVTFILNSK